MPYPRTYKVFVTHCWDGQQAAYRRFKAMLPTLQYMTVVDFGNPDAGTGLSRERRVAALREQMAEATVVLALADLHAVCAEWLVQEVAIARQARKPIVVVRPTGGGAVSQAVQDAAAEVVDWRGPAVGDAIKRLAK